MELFTQIHYIFANPRAKASEMEKGYRYGIALHKMTGASIDTMVQPWRVHEFEGQSAAEAETSSVARLKDSIRDLLRLVGGLSSAKTAVDIYRNYQFGPEWKQVMDLSDSDMTRWSVTWWGEKLDRLKKMIVAEVRDEIGNYNNTGNRFGGAQYVRHYVDKIIQTDKVREEFVSSSVNVEEVDAQSPGHPPHIDRTLITELYTQLPHTDPRWMAAVQKVSSSLSLNPVGIKVDTADTFPTIMALVKHVQKVCEVLTGAKLQDQVQRLLQSEKRFFDHQTQVQAQADHRVREVVEQQAVEQARMKADFQAALERVEAQNSAYPVQYDTMPRTRRGTTGTHHSDGSVYPPHGGDTQQDTRSQLRDNSSSKPITIAVPTRTQPTRQGNLGVNTISGLIYVPPYSFEPLEEEQVVRDDEEDAVGLLPVYETYMINSIAYLRQLSSKITKCIQRLNLNKSEMDRLHPMTIQTHARQIAPDPKVIFNLASIASLVRHTRMVIRSDQVLGNEFMVTICQVVSTVVKQIGGKSITEHDIGGCDRRIETRAHVCKGSHSSKTCPHAVMYPATGTLIHPSLQEVVGPLMTVERLTAACRSVVTERHTIECQGRNGKFARCTACVEYVHQVVYPDMYDQMITLLEDPSVPDADKQEYRVQLAAGLLTAVWGMRGLQ